MTLTELQSLRKDFNTLTTIQLMIDDNQVYPDGLEGEMDAIDSSLLDIIEKIRNKITEEEMKLLNKN